jgi:uncharacterized OsmC-like protein
MEEIMAANKTVSIEANSLQGFAVEVKARQFSLMVDQPPDSGGEDAGPTPLEYLFFSLASCIVTIGLIKAFQERLPLRGIQVKIDGDVDTTVLMGKNTTDRSGFQDIRVTVNVDGDMTKEEKEEFVRGVELRCPVTDNIKNASQVKFIVV